HNLKHGRIARYRDSVAWGWHQYERLVIRAGALQFAPLALHSAEISAERAPKGGAGYLSDDENVRCRYLEVPPIGQFHGVKKADLPLVRAPLIRKSRLGFLQVSALCGRK